MSVQDQTHSRAVIIAIGSNLRGALGDPEQAIARAIEFLDDHGIRVQIASPVYRTAPVGGPRQAKYFNLILLAKTVIRPRALLSTLKRIERLAGRRIIGTRNAARPLDLDLVAQGRTVLGWPPRRRVPGSLMLPHPEMHRRRFVLVPLADIAPRWRHPVLGLDVATLLRRLPRRRGDVHRDSA